MSITKAIIPVAGFGTRFLPVTKSVPKEMLPIVDKPALEYIVEEAVQSGITDICFVVSRSKTSIIDYFDSAPELETLLREKNKENNLNQVKRLSRLAHFVSVRQSAPLGLGHAISLVETFAAGDAVAVLLGDDVFKSDVPTLKSCIDAHLETQSSVIGVQEVAPELAHRYGVVSFSENQTSLNDDTWKINGIVEKPSPGTEPSHLAAYGRYILTPDVFHILKNLSPGKNDEIQLTDALNTLALTSEVYATRLSGTRYDLGSKLGFLFANLDWALDRDDLREPLTAWLKARFHS